MSMEDDLFSMLKHLGLGGKGKLPVDGILKTLMISVEINTLRKMQGELAKMQEHLNRRILQLSKMKPATGVGKDMDPFTILGVRPDATKEEVEKAFKEKAWKAHPDHGGTNEEMVLVNAAREAIRRFMGWQQ